MGKHNAARIDMEDYFNTAEVKTMYRLRALRLMRPTEITIHKNTSRGLEDLAADGFVILYYVPYEVHPSIASDKLSFVSTTDKRRHLGVGVILTGDYNTPELQKEIEDNLDRMKRYLVPRENVREVFSMIRGNKDPSAIEELLKHYKLPEMPLDLHGKNSAENARKASFFKTVMKYIRNFHFYVRG